MFSPRWKMLIYWPLIALCLFRESMPSHFKFKEYCPLVFRNLRERFGIQEAQYMVSLSSPSSFQRFSLMQGGWEPGLADGGLLSAFMFNRKDIMYLKFCCMRQNFVILNPIIFLSMRVQIISASILNFVGTFRIELFYEVFVLSATKFYFLIYIMCENI